MKFSKQKMIERITREGRASMITEEIEAVMDNLDGQEVEKNCWRRRVYEEPVYYVVGKDGQGAYVNENDCI